MFRINLFNRPQRPDLEVLMRWGRNAECWCGSGKKYKNCHMSKDQPKK